MKDDLYRPVPLSKIGAAGLTISVLATPEECSRVAERMGIPAIQSLECSFHLAREHDGVSIVAVGRLQALVTRTCVVSAEDFEAPVIEEFEIRFVPAGSVRDDIDPEVSDEIPYTGETIDLGEAAAEQLGLVLDPYPRMPGALLPDNDDEGDGLPLAALFRRAEPEKS